MHDVIRTGKRLVVLFAGAMPPAERFYRNAVRGTQFPRSGLYRRPAQARRARNGKWYFQRYTDWLPAKGEVALFDRSWYNRGVVERTVFGFRTAAHETFSANCPL